MKKQEFYDEYFRVIANELMSGRFTVHPHVSECRNRFTKQLLDEDDVVQTSADYDIDASGFIGFERLTDVTLEFSVGITDKHAAFSGVVAMPSERYEVSLALLDELVKKFDNDETNAHEDFLFNRVWSEIFGERLLMAIANETTNTSEQL